MQTSEPMRPEDPVTRRVFMGALLVRDLANGNEIEREKHRVLMAKGQILNQKCRDVVRVPEMEVRVAKVFEGVGKSGFGGDEVESV